MPKDIDRRTLVSCSIAGTLGAALALTTTPDLALAEAPMFTRRIPSTGEPMPVIELGTWQTFDIGNDRAERDQRRQVLEVLFNAGGKMIDSSPMYGRAEAVVGTLLREMKARDKAFIATKVWTSGAAAGIAQMQSSSEKMAAPTIDLMQIHNLVDWRTHLKTMRAWKEKGTIRYIGITHYTTSAFDELISIMRAEKGIDFVQIPYSLAQREAEAMLLPLALELSIAVIPNRPFDGANMFSRVKGQALPPWASEIDAKSFGQIYLKYLLGHPAITCVIPGTAKVEHVSDNIAAGHGRIPDDRQRQLITDWWHNL